jgi:hypothetical protein
MSRFRERSSIKARNGFLPAHFEELSRGLRVSSV